MYKIFEVFTDGTKTIIVDARDTLFASFMGFILMIGIGIIVVVATLEKVYKYGTIISIFFAITSIALLITTFLRKYNLSAIAASLLYYLSKYIVSPLFFYFLVAGVIYWTDISFEDVSLLKTFGGLIFFTTSPLLAFLVGIIYTNLLIILADVFAVLFKIDTDEEFLYFD